jgi:hypothetical protein
MVLYHYESQTAGEMIEHAGLRIAHRGERFPLSARPLVDTSTPAEHLRSLPDAAGW